MTYHRRACIHQLVAGFLIATALIFIRAPTSTKQGERSSFIINQSGHALDQSNPRQDAAGTFLIRNVRIFDGRRVIAANSVLVTDGKIVRVGKNLSASATTSVVDGTADTLLPGLFDAHVHVPEDANGALRQAASLGVTTVLDVFTTPATLKKIKTVESEGLLDVADVRTAGIGATVPGGHPTEMGGPPIPTLTEPTQAQTFIDALAL